MVAVVVDGAVGISSDDSTDRGSRGSSVSSSKRFMATAAPQAFLSKAQAMYAPKHPEPSKLNSCPSSTGVGPSMVLGVRLSSWVLREHSHSPGFSNSAVGSPVS